MSLVALPDLNQIARNLNNQKSEKFDENFVNLLSTWIEMFEQADCILHSTLEYFNHQQLSFLTRSMRHFHR